MKGLVSARCKLDTHGLLIITRHSKYALQQATKCFTRHASSTSKETKPRNLFEVFSKNPHWLGVYNRNPTKKEPLSREIIDESLAREKEKNSLVDVESFIASHRAEWTQQSHRVGAIGMKLGHSSLWSKDGKRHNVSLIQVKDCHVLDTQISREDGGKDMATRLIVGAHKLTDEKILSQFSREKVGWHDERDVFPTRFWAGFPVTTDGLLLPGTEITASHFVAGQSVRITGKTKKIGFQGVMRRWGFKGQPATHGQTKTHRKMGATGGGQDPGRTWPGKKMAGHMGGDWRTTKPIKLMRIDRELNVLFVQGYVPGEVDSFVLINDTDPRYGTKYQFDSPPPFPTHFESEETDQDTPSDMYADYMASHSGPSLEFPPHKL